MNCTQCGHGLAEGARFCPECGAKQELKCAACGASLTPGAKFCPECGAKVEGAKVSAGGTAVDHIDLAPLALGLPECKVEITGVEAEGPNNDGEYDFTVKYSVTNDTDEDWKYFETRTQLLSASGQVVEDSRDTNEQTISAGETAELEASLLGVKGKLLGSNPEQAHVVVSTITSGFGQEKLGEIAIPETPFEPVALKAVQIGDTLKLVSGSLWKTEPDDDKDCRVEIKALVQNLTNKHLPEIKIVADVTDKQGRELTDAGGYDEVRPGAVVAINGSGYAKEKKFAGAKANLAICAYYPIAEGRTQYQGVAVTQPELSGEDGDGWQGTRSVSGQVQGCFQANRAFLVRIETPDETYESAEDISSYLDSHPDIVGLLEENINALNAYWDADGTIVENVSPTACLATLISTGTDRLTLKNLVVMFSCEITDADDEDRIQEDLTFGLVPVLEVGADGGTVKFVFTEYESYRVVLNDATGNSSSCQSGGIRHFYAKMDWFNSAEQPAAFTQLPKEFLQAKKLWDLNASASQEQILSMLSPYVGARLILSNIDGWDELFVDTENSGFIEIEAKKVRVVGIDFSRGPIPICKAEAEFEVEVTEGFDSFDLEEWQVNNGQFYDAVSFYWTIERNDDTEDLDFTYGDNQGVECCLLDADLCNDNEESAQLSVSTDRMEMTTAACERFISSAKGRLIGDRIYLNGNLPDKKIQNAITSFAPNVVPEDVLVLIDSTIMGSAKDGLLLTTNKLYVKNLGEGAKVIDLDGVSEVKHKSAIINSYLKINGLDMFQTSGLNKKVMDSFADLLQDLCSELKQD